jgi:hypothetical protein
MAPPPLWGPPPPLFPGAGSAVGAVAGTCAPPGIGAVPVGDGDGFGIGAALTVPTPNVSVDKPMPAAIAAALAKRLMSMMFHSLRGCLCCNPLLIGYPANAETNPAMPGDDVAIGLIIRGKARLSCQAAREDSTG